MNNKNIRARLEQLNNESPVLPINDETRLVIFSDFHMGNGSLRDDFLNNAQMMETVLKDYYYAREYTLILNGDIEELHRFSYEKISQHWHSLYRLWQQFLVRDALYKIFGNHDYALANSLKSYGNIPIYESVKLVHPSGSLLVFHGHQAGRWIKLWHTFTSTVLRYIATPLRIKNYFVAHDSKKRYRVERRAYDFARDNRMISIIGHTHRPLFESLSKKDTLKFKIEELCRKYPRMDEETQLTLAKRIQKYKTELKSLVEKKEKDRDTLYHSDPLVPCLFNSGCAVGKSGVTSIEIYQGDIQLVYWFDEKQSRKYFNFNGYIPEQLPGTDYYRVVLNQEPLDYIFSRIKLLA